MMKIAPLTRGCMYATASKKDYVNSKKQSHTSGSPAKLLSKADKEYVKQRTYCISSLSFLGCLTVVYFLASIFAGNAKF